MRVEGEAERGFVVHCGQFRFVWNRALEQANMYRPAFGPTPGNAERMRQLTEARVWCGWLGEGSSSVQQHALRDFDQAMRNWWKGTHRHPKRRKKGRNDGFRVRDVKVRKLNRKWAELHVPKVGWVLFRLSRPLPAAHGMASVTLDRAGRWHVSFSSVPDPIPAPGNGVVVGVDRGVVRPFAVSDGITHRTFGVARLSPGQAQSRVGLQRKMARQQIGSAGRRRTKQRIGRLYAREADLRREAIEQATTELARTADLIKVEGLQVRNMVRSAKGTVEKPGRNVRAKAGLNRAILAQGWGMFLRRLADKAPGRVEIVPAAWSSLECHACGHVAVGNRKSQAVFQCEACGRQANADSNSADVVRGRTGRVIGRGAVKVCRVEPPSTQVA